MMSRAGWTACFPILTAERLKTQCRRRAAHAGTMKPRIVRRRRSRNAAGLFWNPFRVLLFHLATRRRAAHAGTMKPRIVRRRRSRTLLVFLEPLRGTSLSSRYPACAARRRALSLQPLRGKRALFIPRPSVLPLICFNHKVTKTQRRQFLIRVSIFFSSLCLCDFVVENETPPPGNACPFSRLYLLLFFVSL